MIVDERCAVYPIGMTLGASTRGAVAPPPIGHLRLSLTFRKGKAAAQEESLAAQAGRQSRERWSGPMQLPTSYSLPAAPASPEPVQADAAVAAAAAAATAPILQAVGALRTGAACRRLRLAGSRGRPETAAAAVPLSGALRPLLGALRVAQPPPALLLRLSRDMHHVAAQGAELWRWASLCCLRARRP